jgi:hypothetical protein
VATYIRPGYAIQLDGKTIEAYRKLTPAQIKACQALGVPLIDDDGNTAAPKPDKETE